ncbi:glycoside hydrolase family 2 protein [Tolumonas osonensis]|uniref:Beta-galactosidase n=1 Tax=Tolumonas osonensis TaxID=675874 RepID=A0A841GAR9_9GAMM|nr:glycoside hydrolase family 2 TIM barrel-domain containing protein [Tolumonas osonensis]MBB6056148.1 beta-galactosidase [Tolumonas osonensis]
MMNLCESFDKQWRFIPGEFTLFTGAELAVAEQVDLPHTAVELPYNYFDETTYQRKFSYQKTLLWRSEFAEKQVWLQFDGAMADAKVYLNGKLLTGHRDGYTPFEVLLTPHLLQGENQITVVIDGSENPEISPFGGQIDYLTYAGIYRNVWLKTTDALRIKNVQAIAEDVLTDEKTLAVRVYLDQIVAGNDDGELVARLTTADGKLVAEHRHGISGSRAQDAFRMTGLTGIRLWDIDEPVLYHLAISISGNNFSHQFTTRVGFRQAEFTPDGFLLNGRSLKIRGINRHQSYPYMGYAMGAHAQRADADFIKNTLKFNLVRTSHYPQSPAFLDRCDELGLLVFEEIPGWQHIGDEAWKQGAIANVGAMIQRDWNHPSIVLWGVRINESRDDDHFYERTNRLAHALDPSRQTGGVRCHTSSSLLEDVYTMNDFVLNGGEVALRDQQQVTGLDHKVPYMVTEYNGHMFPTKRFDPEERQHEHVIRHLRVLDACYADPHISGCIAWCLFDYNTHKDFGSGDRICYHGISDMFRIPKFAAYAYKSQCEVSDEPVMQPVTFWARGERCECLILPLIILTNCDEIEFKVGDYPVKRLKPAVKQFPHLPHAPVIIDDEVISPQEFGEWGMKWETVSLRGLHNGQVVCEMQMPANPVATSLRVKSDYSELPANEKAATRVTIEALDQCGNLLPFLDDIISVSVDGPAKIIGPDQLVLKGGAVGLWLEAGDHGGLVTATFTSARLGSQTLELNIIGE